MAFNTIKHSISLTYLIQHYVIKFVCDLWQVELRFMVFNASFNNILVISWRSVSSTNKTDRHDKIEILLQVALNTITLAPFSLTFVIYISRNLYVQY